MAAITSLGRAVEAHTPSSTRTAIAARLARSLTHHAQRPEEIEGRLAELAEEWDIERTLEVNAAALSLGSIVLGMLGGGRRTPVVAGVASAMLLQHAVRGWCPLLQLFRKLGIRSNDEILQEYYALRLLRDGIESLEGMRQATVENQVAAVMEVLEPGATETFSAGALAG